jgi:hypothetical protein
MYNAFLYNTVTGEIKRISTPQERVKYQEGWIDITEEEFNRIKKAVKFVLDLQMAFNH